MIDTDNGYMPSWDLQNEKQIDRLHESWLIKSSRLLFIIRVIFTIPMAAFLFWKQ
jgi:hypothetical protein